VKILSYFTKRLTPYTNLFRSQISLLLYSHLLTDCSHFMYLIHNSPETSHIRPAQYIRGIYLFSCLPLLFGGSSLVALGSFFSSVCRFVGIPTDKDSRSSNTTASSLHLFTSRGVDHQRAYFWRFDSWSLRFFCNSYCCRKSMRGLVWSLICQITHRCFRDFLRYM
jgi:hypothetical protein